MWSSRRAFVFLVLAGCGFAPALGVDAPARALIGQVELAAPTSRDSFDFLAAVETRLGRPAAAAYDLTYAISVNQAGAGVTTSGATTRYTLNGRVDYTLTARADGQRVTGGSVQTFTAWSATGTTVAGITAEADAHRRLMQVLADQVVRRLMMDLS